MGKRAIFVAKFVSSQRETIPYIYSTHIGHGELLGTETCNRYHNHLCLNRASAFTR